MRRRRSPSYDKYRKNYKELSTSPESDKNFALPKEIEKKRKVPTLTTTPALIIYLGMEKKIQKKTLPLPIKR